MTTEQLTFILQLITGSTFLIGVLLALLALFYFRRSRREAFWRFRRQAGQRGFQFSVFGGFMLVVSGAFCMITSAVMFVEGDNTGIETVPTQVAEQTGATDNASPTVTNELAISVPTLPVLPESTETPDFTTQAATANFSPTPEPDTPMPTETHTEAPLPFPSVTLNPMLALTPTGEPSPTEIAQAVPARVQIWAMDDQISDDYAPIQPASVFTTESVRFYFFMDYAGISTGESWSQTLVRDGEILQEQAQQWGLLPSEGRLFFFFGSSEGFVPGNYEVQIRVGEELTTYPFTVQ